jgi:hypothetical protein
LAEERRGARPWLQYKEIQFLTLLLQLTLLGSVLIYADPASSEIRKVKNQTVYVPAYSHIYHGDREAPFYLTVTLSIRNTDPAHPITIVSVDYFDTDGKLLKSYQKGEVKLSPVGSRHYVVQESDKSGGFGANFIIRWRSDTRVNEPIIVSVLGTTPEAWRAPVAPGAYVSHAKRKLRLRMQVLL